MKKINLGILSTHPIQYDAPFFRRLAACQDMDTSVFYCLNPAPSQQGVGFGTSFLWDVDLTGGYRHRFLKNVSSKPGLASFNGCNTPQIADIIRDGGFDAFLVLGWNTRSMWQAMLASWKHGVPVLVRADNQLDASGNPAKGAGKRLVYPWFIRKFSVCLARGLRSEEYFRHYGASRIARLPHFVDNDYFSRRAGEERPKRQALRQALGIGPDEVVFLFEGKFEKKKRPMDLILAFQKIAAVKNDPRMRLILVGDGTLRRECESYVSRHQLAAVFTGFYNQTKMPEAYAVSDALVLPSDRGETWGLVVNEAMASGVPVVVSEAAGCSPDLVASGRTGFTYPCGDVDALCSAMAQVAAADHRAMGEDARRHIADYSIEAAVAHLRAALQMTGEKKKEPHGAHCA